VNKTAKETKALQAIEPNRRVYQEIGNTASPLANPISCSYTFVLAAKRPETQKPSASTLPPTWLSQFQHADINAHSPMRILPAPTQKN